MISSSIALNLVFERRAKLKKKTLIAMAAIILAICCTANAAEKKPSPAPLKFDAEVVLSSLITISDNYIRAITGELEVAALSAEAVSGDFKQIKPLLIEIQKREYDDGIAWFALPDGSYYTVKDGLTGKSLKDRVYFPKVLAGEESVGELVVSKSTGEISTIIAVPVKKDGAVTGILGVSLFTKKLSVQIKKDMGITDDTIFFAINKDHITVINVKPDLVYLDPEAQGESSMTKAIESMLKKDKGYAEYNFHEKRRIYFKKSSYTGWWYAVGKPVK